MSREVRLPAHPVTNADPPEQAGSALSYLAFRAGEAAVAVLPRRVAEAFGCGGATLLALTRPSRFDGLRSNLRHVLPDASSRTLERILRANVRNLVRCWIDVMEMRHRPQQLADRLDIADGYVHYANAVAAGKGVVAVSMHFGAWEAGLAAWNRNGGGMALLAEEVRPPRFFERIVGGRRSMGVKVIPIDAAAMRAGDAQTARRKGAAAMREVMKHLRSGKTIAIALDRDITGTGVMMDFFGSPAPIPIGTVDIAIRAGAAVLPIVLQRSGRRALGWGYPVVEYDASKPRAEEAARVADEVLRIFEHVIREHPDQWHVLEPIWSDGI